jgi:hypothetical protein
MAITGSEKVKLMTMGLSPASIAYLEGLGYTFKDISGMLSAGVNNTIIEYCSTEGYDKATVDAIAKDMKDEKKKNDGKARLDKLENSLFDGAPTVSNMSSLTPELKLVATGVEKTMGLLGLGLFKLGRKIAGK